MRFRSRYAGWAGAAALIAALAAPAAASAQGFGSLNGSFGSGGATLVAAQLLAVATSPTGDVVAVGQTKNNVFVEKVSSTGATEATYTGGTGVARAVTVQSNGDVLIAGSNGGASTQSYNEGSFFVERLTPSLSPDVAFGVGGIATAFSGQHGIANSIALTKSGEILAGGAVAPPNTSAAVAEFTSTGLLDPTFGSGGTKIITQDFTANGGGYGVINSIAVEPDGDIAYAGNQQNAYNVTQGVVGLLDPSGTNVPTFSSGGPYHYSPPGGSSGLTAFNSVAAAPGGQIIVGGVDQGGQNALVLRYNANGSLDSSFGNGGLTTIKAVGSASPNSAVGADAVALGGGSSILASGQYEASATNYSGVLWGLTSTGALDPGFGSNGTALGPVGSTNTPYEGCGMTVASNGTVYTVGYVPTTTPDPTPCATGAGSTGYIASFTGNGPPPTLTAANAPAVTSAAASNVTTTTATVNGSVNPEGLATSYSFQYGTTGAYGSETPSASAGSGTSPVAVSAPLTNLTPDTTYHYRLVAVSSAGTTVGPDATFTTANAGSGGSPLQSPGVFTGVAQKVSQNSALVFGRVNPQGQATSYYWQFDWTTRYRRKTATMDAGSGTTMGIHSVTLGRLAAGHVYHYRLVAVNATGTSYGQDRTFKTAPRLRAWVGVNSHMTLANRKFVARISCNSPCTFMGTLTLWRSWAKRLGFGNGFVTLASRSGRLRNGGHGTLTLFVPTGDVGRLSRVHSAPTTLEVRYKPTVSGTTVTVKKTVWITM